MSLLRTTNVFRRPWGKRPFVTRLISSSNVNIELTNDESKFKGRPAKENLLFGTTPTDHMLLIEWDKRNQWGPTKIVPYQDLKINPAASSLHYGM